MKKTRQIAEDSIHQASKYLTNIKAGKIETAIQASVLAKEIKKVNVKIFAIGTKVES